MSEPATSSSSPHPHVDKMDVDSFPEVEAIIKYEEESFPAPKENEQVDIFLETEMDIKYEFPEPSPPKKKRGRPPPKKAKPVPANASSNGPQSKSCAVKPSIGKGGDGISKKDASNNEADNFILSNRESEESCAVPKPQSPPKKRRRGRPLSSKKALEESDASCPAPPNNEADNFIPSNRESEDSSPMPVSVGSSSSGNSFPKVAAIIENGDNPNPTPRQTAEAPFDNSRQLPQSKIDCGGATRAGENHNYLTAEGSTEIGKRIVPSLTISYELYKTLELKMNEVSRERDALQVKLKASVEANKELELEMNKVILERDALKVSLEQMEQRQLEANEFTQGDATSMRKNLSEEPFTSRKRKSPKPSGNEKGQGQPKPKMSAVVESLNEMDGEDIDDDIIEVLSSNQTISEFDSMDGLTNNASDCSTGLNANLLQEPSTSKKSGAFPTVVANRRELETSVKPVATEPALPREAGENDNREEELTLPNYSVNSTSFFNNPDSIEDSAEEPSNFLVGDVVVLKTCQALQYFLDKANLKPEENPFPAKSLILYLNEKNLNLAFELEKETAGIKVFLSSFLNRFLSNIRELFEKFGRYIHTLQIKCLRLRGIDFLKKFEIVFFDFLCFLPNLKKFEIIKKCWYGCICSIYSHFFVASPYVKLPLEYLGLGGCNNPISIPLLNRYGHQLRKLVLDRSIGENAFNQIQVKSFIQLHELTLHEPLPLLVNFTFPNLVKLTSSNFEILNYLHIFSNFKYFELKLDSEGSFSCVKSAQQPPKLEYIVLPYSEEINYNFLSKFPDLKQVRFAPAGKKKCMWMPTPYLKKSNVFPDIHEMVATDRIYESNIWEKLPKLEVVITEWKGGLISFQRNDYNRHQKLLNMNLIFKSSVFKSKSNSSSPSLTGTSAIVQPTQNQNVPDHASPSTSNSCGKMETLRKAAPSQGGNPLPTLSTCYINRRVRAILKDNQLQEPLTEEEFFNTTVRKFSNNTIAIFGEDATGKTKFLAQMGRKILSAFPDRKLFYLEVKDVLHAVNEKLGDDKSRLTTEIVWSVLQRLTGKSQLGKKAMTKTELFFDGFEEVKCENLVYNILRQISPPSVLKLTGIRIWVANVPKDLNSFKGRNDFSYYIEPLDEASQVELIASYWEKQTGKDKSILLNLAKQLVQYQMNLENKKFDLGNPFQCLVMGAACLQEGNFIDYNDPSYFKTERIIKLVREWNSNSKINAGF